VCHTWIRRDEEIAWKNGAFAHHVACLLNAGASSIAPLPSQHERSPVMEPAPVAALARTIDATLAERPPVDLGPPPVIETITRVAPAPAPVASAFSMAISATERRQRNERERAAAVRLANERAANAPAPTESRADEPTDGIGGALRTVQTESLVNSTAQRSYVEQRQIRQNAVQARRAIERATRGQMRMGDMIAGACAEGEGRMLGWAGLGERPRSFLLAALETANCPITWAPRSKSAHAHAGQAAQSLSSSGLVVRAERRAAGSTRTYSARWAVGQVSALNTSADPDAFGKLVLTITLHDETLTCEAREGYEDLANRVQDAYRKAVDGETYAAGEITIWLRDLFVSRFGACKLGGNFYVPRGQADKAEALCTALSRTWGKDWMLPGLPVANSHQLQEGLARGLREEVAAVRASYDALVETAREKGTAVGVRAVSALLVELQGISDRTTGYAAMLGNAAIESVRREALALLALCGNHVGDAVQRSAMLWDELLNH
jgi:hypothetical protein